MPLSNVAFIFPGQGSQHVGMGQDLYDAFAPVRDLFAEADDALGYPLSRIIRSGPEAELRKTANTQPAILLVSLSVFRLLDAVPGAVAGHSLGEYSALVAAGALSLRDALTLVHQRGQYMQSAVPEGAGAMFALVGAVDADSVLRAIADVDGPVDIANYNAPDQIVIAGARDAARQVAERAGARHTVELAVSAPFHCRLMQPAEKQLSGDLEAMPFADPRIPLYNNVDAQKVTTADAVRQGLKRQVSRAVRWTGLVQRMISEQGIDTFVEVGPGKVLSGLIRRIDRRAQRLAAHDCATVESVRTALRARAHPPRAGGKGG